MIFERPYYTFNQGDFTLHNFGSFYSAVWVCVITMSSVGYGNLIATTTLGRFVTMVAILVGACLLSLLVTLILGFFVLKDKQEETIFSMKHQTYAV